MEQNFKNKTQKGFTLVLNTAIEDKEISWKAKGILVYLLSKPDSWRFYETQIKEMSTDGLRSVKTGIQELIQAGYLLREQLHNEKGFAGYKYEVVAERVVTKRNNTKGATSNTNNSNTNNISTNVDKPQAYGNENINNLLQVFQDEYKVKPPPRDRQYASNLIKAYGSQMDLVGLAKAIIQAGKTDEYAPQITSAKDMYYKMGKISKYVQDNNNNKKGAFYV